MEQTFDMGWLVVITNDSRVAKLRISAAMDMSSFVAFESAEDDTVPAGPPAPHPPPGEGGRDPPGRPPGPGRVSPSPPVQGPSGGQI